MKVERSQVLQLSIYDTRVLKGVALFMLLCHHCLYTGNEYDDVVVFGYPLFKSFGVFCKLCVSIFVFLSGYGLTICALRNNGIGQPIRFYKRRYVKLMINYWLIWLIFVPVGVLCFERTFPEVYGDYYILKGIVDFFGLYNAVFYTPYGYNATWWFYGCIIVLYLLFPLIWYFRNYWFLMIPLALFMPVLGRIPIFGSSGAFGYLLPFICGMTFASEKLRCGGGG